jgi:3-oxoacyl-[acyl-carrier-protein] synthase III
MFWIYIHISVADQFINKGYKNILVIGAEYHSNGLNIKNYKKIHDLTAIFNSDGARRGFK